MRHLFAGMVEAAQGQPTMGQMIMGQVLDKRKVDLPWGYLSLPQWDPVQVGPLTIDFSPTKHVFFLFVSALVTALLLLWTARQTRARAAGKAPSGLAGVLEAGVLFVRNDVAMANIGKGGERYVPFIVTVFFFIAVANLIGLLPWGVSPTSNLSVTAALALMSLAMIELAGMRALGLRGYMGTIVYWPHGMSLGLKLPLTLIMTPVEILGKLTKPFALAIRLFANMAAGKFIILSLVGLIFVAGPVAGFIFPVLAPIVMAVAITILKLFVSLLQAYIFAMLTSVFIGLISHAH
jgi:F-type H+-transporting ATPase subunit a